MDVSDYIQLVMMLLTGIGLIVTVVALLVTVRNFQQQSKLSFFADYTKRYQEIMLNLPESVYRDDFSEENLKEKEEKDFARYMRIYFDLCSEEYHLWKIGHIDKKVWQEWEEGLQYSFSKPAFKEAWGMFEIYNECYTDFYKFIVEDIQKGENK